MFINNSDHCDSYYARGTECAGTLRDDVSVCGMTGGNLFSERDESLANLWLFIIINTTVLALLINILSLHYGSNEVAPDLLYIPVVIAAYWYPHRGPLFAVVISVAYMALVALFMGSSAGTMISSSVICYVLIGVSVVVSSLATHMRKNEVKYRGLFNHSPAGVGLVDFPARKILEANNRFSAMLGYTGDEITTVPFGDLFLDADRRDLFFRQLEQSGSIENFDARFRSKDAKSRWMLVSAGMLPDKQFVATIIDITERKHAELALLIKDHAISSSINAIAILDLDFNITYVNQSLLRQMEYHDENEFIGRNMQEFFYSPAEFGNIREHYRKSHNWFGECILLRYNNQSPFYVLLWMNTVRDDKGEAICIMTSFIDITERKQMLVVKRKALEQIEKNIEQFAILGDNIRNPLAVIVGLSSLAEGEVSDRILVQTKEIDRIVDQLDKGWVESENVRGFIRKYYQVGSIESGERNNGKNGKNGNSRQ
jgi:PAS domain S-box-containing protein